VGPPNVIFVGKGKKEEKEKKNKGKKMWGVAMVVQAWSFVAPLL
jgi:hypothetical protein